MHAAPRGIAAYAFTDLHASTMDAKAAPSSAALPRGLVIKPYGKGESECSVGNALSTAVARNFCLERDETIEILDMEDDMWWKVQLVQPQQQDSSSSGSSGGGGGGKDGAVAETAGGAEAAAPRSPFQDIRTGRRQKRPAAPTGWPEIAARASLNGRRTAGWVPVRNKALSFCCASTVSRLRQCRSARWIAAWPVPARPLLAACAARLVHGSCSLLRLQAAHICLLTRRRPGGSAAMPCGHPDWCGMVAVAGPEAADGPAPPKERQEDIRAGQSCRALKGEDVEICKLVSTHTLRNRGRAGIASRDLVHFGICSHASCGCHRRRRIKPVVVVVLVVAAGLVRRSPTT
eukprot:SAG22_NODE_161_length_16908_cov_39.687965_17_plen_347_part_00